MNNNIRFDLSNYLIHFFRDIDLESDNYIPFPEHMGWSNLTETSFLHAFFMLRAALKNGRLWATWSLRKGKRTIYGPNPAICFTEMPIAAFLQASNIRWQQGEAMSPFALVFPKEELFKLGARPVISGISKELSNKLCPYVDEHGNRMLPTDIYHPSEQFRYVTFSLGNQQNIDWTHEREWRWPYHQNQNSQVDTHDFNYIENWSDIPGLDLYNLSQLGVIVKTEEQAKKISHDLLSLIDSKKISEDTFSFILITDNLTKTEKLQHPIEVHQAISNAMINLKRFLLPSSEDVNLCSQFFKLISNIENNAGDPIWGQYGGCWLWLHDNTTPLTRALIRNGRAFVSDDGRYLVHLYEFSDLRSLQEREKMTGMLANSIQQNFGTSCCYFSVAESDNPNGVPFYIGNHDHTIDFYNWNNPNK